MIGERQAAILSLIIDSYIKTGEPIGSKTLANLLPYKISSATIRNEMAYLSELGLLEQMHTSGGRIPSKSSYRYYVNNLMVEKPIEALEKEKISEFLSINASDPQRLLKDAVSLLAEETNCTAFYCTVKDELDCIQGVEIIPAGSSKAMIVMLTVGGKIRSSVCRLNCPADEEFKALFYRTMADYFIGTPLSEVNLVLIQSTAPALKDRIFDMLPVLTSLCSLCKEAYEPALFIEGETNLLSHEELSGEVYKLLSFLADKEQFKRHLAQYAKYGKEFELLIGNENYHPLLKNTSTVLAKYNYNNSQSAVLGIIGSTRIDYSSILPRVEYIMKTVKKFLQEGGAQFE
ncbi:MAG: heat-inducible transcriptional repressor HrcA [Eubacterium sp.]